MSDNIINEDLNSRILAEMETVFGKEACEMWLKPLKLTIEGGVLTVQLPNKFWSKTIADRYTSAIKSSLEAETGAALTVKYNVAEDTIYNDERKQNEIREILATPIHTPASAFPNRLNPNYTFEGFIEGPSNRFAFRAAEAVVKKLGERENNPLVIYSTPGLGKTHLLHAIGNRILKENPSAKILYMSGEEFVSEYIESLQNRNPEAFRKKHRSLDCFLMDDIQFVAGKESSVQEFFYTFNALFESKKQIVLTSDRTPQQLGIDPRLSSRLLSGIVTEIKRPDLETRIAILRQKRDSSGFDVGDDVIAFIAEGVQASIRELEGCLFRLTTYCNIHGVTATIPIAREVLSDIISMEERRLLINVNSIKKVVAKHFKIDIIDFNSKRKNHSIAWPRQIAMYLSTELTDMSLPEIGREFERDHSTVVHAREKIKEEVENDPFFAAQINQIIADIKAVDKR
ncbi:chromosomal replication initiator protein [Elusimicrobium simillimum]|uniref:chromosomal replication initiator protein DnaA n=1 Tax=Elusimicrobium simillimum TaxID=3143438 RepID=UPI003C6EEE50